MMFDSVHWLPERVKGSGPEGKLPKTMCPAVAEIHKQPAKPIAHGFKPGSSLLLRIPLIGCWASMKK